MEETQKIDAEDNIGGGEGVDEGATVDAKAPLAVKHIVPAPQGPKMPQPQNDGGPGHSRGAGRQGPQLPEYSAATSNYFADISIERAIAVSSATAGTTSEEGSNSNRYGSSTTKSSGRGSQILCTEDAVSSASHRGASSSAPSRLHQQNGNGATRAGARGGERLPTRSQESSTTPASQSSNGTTSNNGSSEFQQSGSDQQTPSPSVNSLSAHASSTVRFTNARSSGQAPEQSSASRSSNLQGFPTAVPTAAAAAHSMTMPPDLARALALVLQAQKNQQQMTSNTSIVTPSQTMSNNSGMQSNPPSLPGAEAQHGSLQHQRPVLNQGTTNQEGGLPPGRLEQAVLSLLLQRIQGNSQNANDVSRYTAHLHQPNQWPMNYHAASQSPAASNSGANSSQMTLEKMKEQLLMAALYRQVPPPAPVAQQNNLASILQQLGLFPRQETQPTTSSNIPPPAGPGASGQAAASMPSFFQQQGSSAAATGIESVVNNSLAGQVEPRGTEASSRPSGDNEVRSTSRSKGAKSSSSRKKKKEQSKHGSSSHFSSTSGGAGQKESHRNSADSYAFPSHYNTGSSAGNNTSGTIVLPCGARGMPTDHNYNNAYLVISPSVKHGDELECSYDTCREAGVKFRYCSVCRIPVAKRNFHQRHSHGISMDPNSAPQSRSKQPAPANPSKEIQAILPQGAARARKRKNPSDESTTDSSSEKNVSRRSRKRRKDRSSSIQNISSAEAGHKDSKRNNSLPVEVATDMSINRQWRWASLLGKRPNSNDTEGMTSWLLEVMAVSDLKNPLNVRGTSSLTNSSTEPDRSGLVAARTPAAAKTPAQENSEEESTSEEALSSLTTGGGTLSESGSSSEREHHRIHKHSRKRSRSRSNEPTPHNSSDDHRKAEHRKKKRRKAETSHS